MQQNLNQQAQKEQEEKQLWILKQNLSDKIATGDVKECGNAIDELVKPSIAQILESEEQAFLERVKINLYKKTAEYLKVVEVQGAGDKDVNITNVVESVKHLKKFDQRFPNVTVENDVAYNGNVNDYDAFAKNIKTFDEKTDLKDPKNIPALPDLQAMNNGLNDQDYGYLKYIQKQLDSKPYMKDVDSLEKRQYALNILSEGYSLGDQKYEGKFSSGVAMAVRNFEDDVKLLLAAQKMNSDITLKSIRDHRESLSDLSMNQMIEEFKKDPELQGKKHEKELKEKIKQYVKSIAKARHDWKDALHNINEKLEKDPKNGLKEISEALEDDIHLRKEGKNASIGQAAKALDGYVEQVRNDEKEIMDKLRAAGEVVESMEPIKSFIKGVVDALPSEVQELMKLPIGIAKDTLKFILGLFGLILFKLFSKDDDWGKEDFNVPQELQKLDQGLKFKHVDLNSKNQEPKIKLEMHNNENQEPKIKLEIAPDDKKSDINVNINNEQNQQVQKGALMPPDDKSLGVNINNDPNQQAQKEVRKEVENLNVEVMSPRSRSQSKASILSNKDNGGPQL